MRLPCNVLFVLCTKPFSATSPCLEGPCGLSAIPPGHPSWGRGQECTHFPQKGKPRLRDENSCPGGSWPGPFSTRHTLFFNIYYYYFIFTVFVVTKGILALCEETQKSDGDCKWRAEPSAAHPDGWCVRVRVQGRAVWVQLVFKSSSASYLLCNLGQETSPPRVLVFLPAKWSNYMCL